MIRIVSWNLGHQTHEWPIPLGFIDTVKALLPDVLVLNEYVPAEEVFVPCLALIPVNSARKPYARQARLSARCYTQSLRSRVFFTSRRQPFLA